MSTDRIYEILYLLPQLSYDAEVPLLEEAVRLAAALHNEDLGWTVRCKLVTALSLSGAPDKVLVTYAWLEAANKRDPVRFPVSEILWERKFTTDQIACFPQLSLAQIETAFEGFRKQYEENGLSLKPYWVQRWNFLRNIGAASALQEEAFHAWQRAPRDSFSDCMACETDELVGHFVRRGDLDEALRVAAPILSGQRHCAEVPGLTYAKLMEATWRAGRHELAKELYAKARRKARVNAQDVPITTALIRLLLLSGKVEEAHAAFQRFAPGADQLRNPRNKLDFLQAIWLLTQQPSPRKEVTTSSAFGPQGASRADWGARLLAEIQELAGRFDQRNGNTYVSETLAADRATFMERGLH